MNTESTHIDSESKYILAAEDSMVQSKKLKHFFETHDINYVICKNGFEALEQAKIRKPTIIISDIVMPIMDGYELCFNVKKDRNLLDVPLILLTSLSDPLDIIKGLQSGADNFITKPYDDEYLLSRINLLMANKAVKGMGFSDMSIEIIFQNQTFVINSDKKQILDLLLSVYEAAIHRNTQLIEAQNQLQKLNNDLLSANNELEAFAHTVSHDLRTPINGITGFAELIKSSYEETNDEEGIEYIDYILESSQNMKQLIEDLLSFSRSGKGDVIKEKFNLSKMVEEIIASLRYSTFKNNYKIEIQSNVFVEADEEMMSVVMTNLLNNALKYSQKSPSPEIIFGSKVLNEKQIIFVKDNGAGFNMDTAENLFKPFVRLHGNNEFQGTGVGLSTVKRIIDRHDGSIWVESKINMGTVFYFTL